MSDQSGSSHLQVLFEAALQEYEKQTGIALAEHPLAERLGNCNTVESVFAILHEQTQAFGEFRGKDEITNLLKRIISILYKLAATAHFGQAFGLHFQPVTAIYTGLAIMISSIKGVIDDYIAVVDLLESIQHFLNRLDIFTRVPPTVAMTETVVKILVELLSTFALATKQIKQGRSRKFIKKLLGEKDVEAVIQRLDRLTQDEARITAAQTLEVVHGLMHNMRMETDDRKASVDKIRDTLETMQLVVSDASKSKRDNLQQDIFKWLSPPDPWRNHNIARKSRHPGSATWFIQGDAFLEWKGSEAWSSLLWVHGKSGMGKSVLCSAIIEDLDAMRKAGLASLAFFYCDSREDQKKDLRGLLSSLLVQLCHQSDPYWDILSMFYLEQAKGLRRPSDDALVGCLKDLLKLPGLAPVYLIVDALDECPDTPAIPSPRAEILNLLEELIKSQFPNLRICVTGRLEADIQAVLTPLAFRSVSLHDKSGHKDDIDNYIKFVVDTDPVMESWKVDDKEWAIRVLMEQADGRFGWVYSEMVYIRQFPERTQELLANLSAIRNDIYRRFLGEIKEEDRELAHCMFQCVAVASRPLHVEELAEFLAFDFTVRPIPKFYEHRRRKVDAVLSLCSNLLSVVEVDGSSIIQFLDSSVKEYLASPHLFDASDTTSPLSRVLKTPAHTRAAQACLCILLHLDNDVTRDSLQEYPLAEYAAEHLIDHVRFEDVQQDVEEELRCLFDPNKRHLAVSVWIHDPAIPFWRRTERAERPTQPSGTPLHYAALYGLCRIVEYLITEYSLDVHSRGLDDGSTPLHVVSSRGYIGVARILLDHGADATAWDQHGWTPLHNAAFTGDVTVAGVLLEHGADVTAQNKLGSTPLHQASRRGHVQVARILLKHGADVEAEGKHGWTPLHEASSGGYIELVRSLLEHGADVRTQDTFGWTPYLGATSGGHVKLARMLLERGADAKAQDRPLSLHEASDEGYADFTRVLLERGADANAQDEQGSTPLHKASEGGHADVIFVLLEHHADTTARDKRGLTPLHQASRRGHVNVTRTLLKHGADAAARDKLSWTPLHHSCIEGHVEVARVLLEHGALATAQDKLGWSPLHGASLGGHVELAHFLIENGAKVTAKDNQGWTPLHQVCGRARSGQRGHAEVAQILLDVGADVGAKDKLGWTPLHRALSMGDVEVARVLLDRDADREARDEDGRTPLDCALPWMFEEYPQLLSNPSPEISGSGRCCTMQ